MDIEEKRTSYEDAIRKIRAAFEATNDPVARMAMVSAFLVRRSDDIIWAGFFLLKNGQLTVGPYNGPPALPVLPKHQGVCWTCLETGKPVIVPNTHEFKGHIRRAGPSNSEVSVPIKDGEGNSIGVLHHDSADFDVFDEVDVEYLERIVGMIEESLIDI